MGCCCVARVEDLPVTLAQQWHAPLVEDAAIAKLVKPGIELQKQILCDDHPTTFWAENGELSIEIQANDPATAPSEAAQPVEHLISKNEDKEMEEFACQICYESSEYGLSLDCQHFYCRSCIIASLQYIKDIGQFPAYCPACRAEAVVPEQAAHNEVPLVPSKGRIHPSVLSFLRLRGVVDEEFQFSFWKLDENSLNNELNSPSYFRCPFKDCSRFLVSQAAVFIQDNRSVYMKPGMCPSCGSILCFACHRIITVANEREEKIGANHVCPPALVHQDTMDPLSSEMISSLCKKCPQCGFPCEKNDGCRTIQCGTTCHGKVTDALRNGGCSFLFDWKTLQGVNSLYIDTEGKRVWNGNPITNRQRRYIETFVELKNCVSNMGNGVFCITSRLDHGCVSVLDAKKGNGAQIGLIAKGNRLPNQQWLVKKVSQEEDDKVVYSLHPQHCPTKCLDVQDVSFEVGHFVHQWEYGGGNNQKWRLSLVENTSDVYFLVSCNSGMALEMRGSKLFQNKLHLGDTQQFCFEPA